jgi:hypothetical protein
MSKKCIICEKEAKFSIKGSNETYCEECANESFGDLSLLVKVEDQAKKLKKIIREQEKFNEEE